MSAATCAVLAQIVPVFLLALLFSGGYVETMAWLGRAGVFTATMQLSLLLTVEALLVVGVQDQGLHGLGAGLAWGGSAMSAVVVIAGVLGQMLAEARAHEVRRRTDEAR